MVLEPKRLCFLSADAFESETIELAAVARWPVIKEPRALVAALSLWADTAERKTISLPKIGSSSLAKLCLFIRTGDRRRYGLFRLTPQLSHAELEIFDWKADIIEALDVASGSAGASLREFL
jgi:hypothetical protein